MITGQDELIYLIDDEESDPTNPSIQLNGVEIREHDLLSLTPGRMINYVIATALLKVSIVGCKYYVNSFYRKSECTYKNNLKHVQIYSLILCKAVSCTILTIYNYTYIVIKCASFL
jgi:hypothetical protein